MKFFCLLVNKPFKGVARTNTRFSDIPRITNIQGRCEIMDPFCAY